jgi:hypothetical protein
VNGTPNKAGRKVTLIELLWFSFCCFSGFQVGQLLARHWGTAGWVVGALGGFAFGVLVLLAAGKLIDFYYVFRPLRPRCRQGKCGPTDYSIVKVSRGRGALEAVFRCRCGDMYMDRDEHFQILLSDSSLQPYMLRKPFHNWEPDV